MPMVLLLQYFFKPVCANAFGFPVLLLVPSGKITAVMLFYVLP
jgi:hypothetical protein